MIGKILGGLAGVGLAGAVTAAILQPQALASVLAATGGALGATGCVGHIKKEEQNKVDEANRVSNAFNYLYESNRGLVAPNQLSLLSGVELEKINLFLGALANEQQGQYIPTQNGNIVSFPHPAAMLQEMTNNANAWAENQTQKLAAENQKMRQQIALINAARMSKAQAGGPPPRAVAPNGRVAQADPANSVEPWNNLL